MAPMSGESSPTALLLAWGQGDPEAFQRLVPLVHEELRRVAMACMARERTDHTLQPTALVNEAYLRLIDIDRIAWRDRTHFLAMAARTMRRVLVDAARARDSRKRGGEVTRVTFDDLAFGAAPASAPRSPGSRRRAGPSCDPAPTSARCRRASVLRRAERRRSRCGACRLRPTPSNATGASPRCGCCVSSRAWRRAGGSAASHDATS